MQGHPTFPGRMSLSSYIRRSSLTVDDHRLSPLTMTVNNRACNQHMKTSNIRMKQISFFLSVLLFLLFFLLLEGPMFYIPYYHEQHHLFLFTQTYLDSHLSAPGQLLGYLTDFCIQFFYLPHTGKGWFALLLSLPYLLNVTICHRLTRKHDLFLLALVPSLWLLIQYLSVDFPVAHIVGLDFCLLVYWAISSVKPNRLKLILFIPATAILYWICGWIYPVITLIIILIPMLSALSVTGYITNKKYRLATNLFSLLVYAGGTFYFFIFSYNMRERLIIEAEIHLKAGQWEQVIDCCRRYRGQNQLILYLNNIALYHTGKMPDNLFDYPQTMGVQSLYLPWKSDSRQTEYGHYIYEQLGYINEAHRWAFEAMTVFGETAPNLINLIRYNIVNHRPKVAMRFIRKLKHSLFYRKQAEKLEKHLSSGELTGLKTIPYDKDEKVRFANILNIGPELSYLCDKDSTNRMAFEYLMSDLLLSNQLVRFAENLKRIRSFSYPALPRIYEEALYTYRLGVDEDTFNKLGFDISPATEERFKAYYALYQRKDRQALKKQFGNTYWYYLNFLSPYGNKVITK